MGELRIGVMGLDTSHTIEFTRRAQAPDCPQDQKVEGLEVINCLRFPSPFQSEPDQDKRQKQMEDWGVKVTRDLEEAIEGIDAIMLEINDPSLHLEYFKKVMDAGKPIFLDKPPAENLKNAKEIFNFAQQKNLKVFSSSSLRFAPQVIELSKEVIKPKVAMSIGPLGKALSGSSIVWYGVHAMEMLQRIIGTGAKKVFACKDSLGVVARIEYSDGRRGVVQLNEGVYHYGIFAHSEKGMKFFSVDASHLYTDLLKKIKEFFLGAEPPVSMSESLEIQAILNAIEESVNIGKEQILSL